MRPPVGDLEKTGVVEGGLEVGGHLIEMENGGKQLLAGVQGIQHVQKPRGRVEYGHAQWSLQMPFSFLGALLFILQNPT